MSVHAGSQIRQHSACHTIALLQACHICWRKPALPQTCQISKGKTAQPKPCHCRLAARAFSCPEGDPNECRRAVKLRASVPRADGMGSLSAGAISNPVPGGRDFFTCAWPDTHELVDCPLYKAFMAMLCRHDAACRMCWALNI